MRNSRAEKSANASPGRGRADLRVALYSHDTMGIGHLRRNLLIARALASPPTSATVLLIAGACQAGVFPLPPGVDWLTLPSLYKQTDGRYRSRRLSLALNELVRLRADTMCAALHQFQPDLLIVDKLPRGAEGELDAALGALAAGRTRLVLGLRDVLDDPAVVRREWRRAGNDDAIARFYDAVWVYGDPKVYNPVMEYRLSRRIADKVQYTGYFDPASWLSPSAGTAADPLAELGLPPGRLALCLVGGGQDGAELARAFSRIALPAETNAVLLTGPFLPETAQRGLLEAAAGNPRLRVLGFLPGPERLLRRADWIVAMGGYNTVCEILSFQKPALIVPRVQPRSEQLIRARRLHALGLLDMLHPDDARPDRLSAWLASSPARPQARGVLDVGGLARLPQLAQRLLTPNGASPLTSTSIKDWQLAPR